MSVENSWSYKTASIEDMSVEDFDGLFAVKVRVLRQQLLPVMHQGGCIVFVSLLSAHAVLGAIAASAASKARSRSC